MARSKTKRDGLVAVASDSELAKHALGRLLTYGHADKYVNGSTGLRQWVDAGLDPADFPKVRTSTHVFQTAARSVESPRTRSNGHVVEVKVDEVLNDKSECVYQITRMVRDRSEKVIEHAKSMRVTLTKSTGQITVDELDDYEALRGLEERIREHVAAHAKEIHGQKIRNAIRDVLHKVGAQSVRRGKVGGLYFVPKTYRKPDGNGGTVEATQPTLEAVARFLEAVYGDDQDFYAFPMLDGEGERDMLRKHFTMNVKKELRATMEEAVQRVRQGKGDRGVRDDFKARLYNERRRLLGAVDDFDKLVNLERLDISEDLRDLDKALGELEDLDND